MRVRLRRGICTREDENAEYAIARGHTDLPEAITVHWLKLEISKGID